MKTVLMTIDLSEEQGSLALLEAALVLVRHHGARLHVVSVLPSFGLPQVSGHFREGFEKEALKQFGNALKQWVKEHVPDDVEVHPHVLQGTIYDEVLRSARKLSADVIVIGSHRPVLKDYLLGPNAARVVRHATCSVYVVRP